MKQEDLLEIGLIGLNHITAPVDMREKFSLDENDVSMILERTKAEGIDEVVCVSTCNRMEIYFTSPDSLSTVESILGIIEDISSLSKDQFKNILYKKYSKEAVFHLLTVTSSLDSMVIGENEIFGQIKDSYRNSVEKKRTGSILNRLFHQAFNTAKRVRTETEISKNPLSVAFIATELAKSIFDDMAKRKALLIGAGEMGELILKYLTKYNLSGITIANRSYHNAERIVSEINKKADIIPLDDIYRTLPDVDIIISSVSSPDYIISYEQAKDTLKKKKGKSPIFLIDIAVPRSIDPKITKLGNMFLYNIDDLKSIADKNLKRRLKEVDLAKQLIESDTEDFFKWYDQLSVVPTIVKIQNQFNEIRIDELDKYKRRKLKHISEEDFCIIEELTKQIMTKTLHNPIIYVKNMLNDNDEEKKKVTDKTKFIEELFLNENGNE